MRLFFVFEHRKKFSTTIHSGGDNDEKTFESYRS